MTISNEELLLKLNEAIAQAQSASVAANAAAGAANAVANQVSSGAAGGVAGARTQSNVEQASVNDTVSKLVQQQVESDIDTPEAWKANVKRTYDIHQTYDMETSLRNRLHFDTLITQLQTHLSNVNQLTMQSLSNNQNQSNMNNTLAIDRSWNINETDLAAKSAAVLSDAVLSGAVKVAAANKEDKK